MGSRRAACKGLNGHNAATLIGFVCQGEHPSSVAVAAGVRGAHITRRTFVAGMAAIEREEAPAMGDRHRYGCARLPLSHHALGVRR